MQFDAIAHAGLKMGENGEKRIKKTGVSMPVFSSYKRVT